MYINISLDLTSINIILQALVLRPYGEVSELINIVKAQAEEQLKEKETEKTEDE